MSSSRGERLVRAQAGQQSPNSPASFMAGLLAVVLFLGLAVSSCVPTVAKVEGNTSSARAEQAALSSSLQTEYDADQSVGSSVQGAYDESASGSTTAQDVSKKGQSSVLVLDQRLTSVVEDGVPMSAQMASEYFSQAEPYASNVEEMLQLPLLPSGCELVSLCIALKSMGIEVNPAELADNHVYISGNYQTGYLSSPYSESGGCFPGPLANVGNSYLNSLGVSVSCHNITGSAFEGLEALVEAGYPVLIWTTIYQDDPEFEDWESGWWINEHCVVMHASDGANVYVSDPLRGLTTYDRDTFKSVYEKCGSRALYVR